MPLLALGLPTSATAAILIAAFQQYGLQPGPLLFEQSPDLVWGRIASLFIGNTMLLVLNLPLAPMWAKLLYIPRVQLYAGIVLFASLGVYAVNGTPVDLVILYVVGLVGFAMSRFGWPIAPAIIGVILGPLAETQLRRALTISQGDYTALVDSPRAVVLFAVAGVVLLAPLVAKVARRDRAVARAPGGYGPVMDFNHSARAQELLERLRTFVTEEIAPVEAAQHARLTGEPVWEALPEMAGLKARARELGLWNLFLPDVSGLTNVEYAPLAEVMGRSYLAAEATNCSAPDTGNMEVLHHFGTQQQKDQWLRPLLEGEIRSAFCMTERDVASSDATNMQATAVVEGDEVVVNGTKWWSTGVGHPDCRLLVFMGLSDPAAARHQQHTMVLVPRDAPGVTVERMLQTMGWWDEPSGHGQVRFDDVRVPLSNVIGGVGGAFAVAQGRLGPGRVHHCMRAIGLAERVLDAACARAVSREAFGKPIANLGGNRERLADARMAIDQARLLVLHAAWLLDTQGLLGALSAVSAIKVVVPNVLQSVVDLAIQLHGGAGLSQDTMLGPAWTVARALRLADGPDEVHRGVVAKVLLAPYVAAAKERAAAGSQPRG